MAKLMILNKRVRDLSTRADNDTNGDRNPARIGTKLGVAGDPGRPTRTTTFRNGMKQ